MNLSEDRMTRARNDFCAELVESFKAKFQLDRIFKSQVQPLLRIVTNLFTEKMEPERQLNRC